MERYSHSHRCAHSPAGCCCKVCSGECCWRGERERRQKPATWARVIIPSGLPSPYKGRLVYWHRLSLKRWWCFDCRVHCTAHYNLSFSSNLIEKCCSSFHSPHFAMVCVDVVMSSPSSSSSSSSHRERNLRKSWCTFYRRLIKPIFYRAVRNG